MSVINSEGDETEKDSVEEEVEVMSLGDFMKKI